MIRIARDAKVPGNLVRWGGRQTQLDCDAFDLSPNEYRAGKPFDSRNYYAKPPVRDSLFASHHGKCCYCERTLPKPELEVEHFRPRRGVRQLPDQPTHDYPGYYWLAYAWTNLLLACRTCNGNKSNRFPLRNPTKRARSHQDDLAKERPLFVDPTAMNPR